MIGWLEDTSYCLLGDELMILNHRHTHHFNYFSIKFEQQSESKCYCFKCDTFSHWLNRIRNWFDHSIIIAGFYYRRIWKLNYNNSWCLSYSSFNLRNSIHSVVHTKFVCYDKWIRFFFFFFFSISFENVMIHILIQECFPFFPRNPKIKTLKQNMNPFLFFKHKNKIEKKTRATISCVPLLFSYICELWLLYTLDLPKSNSFTSDAALSPSARNALSIFFDLSIASLSLDALTAQPILKC